MNIVQKSVTVFAVLMIAAGMLAAESTGRCMALVIGNSDYQASPPANPVNDARDMAGGIG